MSKQQCEICGQMKSQQAFSVRHQLIATSLMRFQKRRANLLYKLRRKGIEADTKQRVIFIPYGEEPAKHIQVIRLCREFYFNIQFIIT